ncbi:MAG: OmpA family [Myxococcales bacterium]|nr:OmpA family [Myxococcales bacterium]
MPTLCQLATLVALLAAPLTAHADAPVSEAIELGTRYADAMTMPSDEHLLYKVVEFAPSSTRVYSREREQLMSLAKSWAATSHRAEITVHGYSDSLDLKLAEHRAERIRGYLIKYGVDPARVATVGHTLDQGGRRVDLAIASCEKQPGRCEQRASR